MVTKGSTHCFNAFLLQITESIVSIVMVEFIVNLSTKLYLLTFLKAFSSNSKASLVTEAALSKTF